MESVEIWKKFAMWRHGLTECHRVEMKPKQLSVKYCEGLIKICSIKMCCHKVGPKSPISTRIFKFNQVSR